MTEPEILDFFRYLIIDCGYRDVQPIGRAGVHYTAIAPHMCTHAIILGRIGNRYGYADRWCYPNYFAASRALHAWDGNGEPTGWIRHPASGRRVAQEAIEYDNAGQPHAMGELYQRD